MYPDHGIRCTFQNLDATAIIRLSENIKFHMFKIFRAEEMTIYGSVDDSKPEAEPENRRHEASQPSSQPSTLACKSLFILIFITIFFIGTSYNMSNVNYTIQVMQAWLTESTRRSESRQSTSIVLSVQNEYSSKNYTMFPYPFLDGALLLEPYRESTVLLSGADSKCMYTWSMQSVGSKEHSWQGSVDADSMSFIVDPFPQSTGEYEINVAGNFIPRLQNKIIIPCCIFIFSRRIR